MDYTETYEQLQAKRIDQRETYREPGSTRRLSASDLKSNYMNQGNIVLVDTKLEKEIGLGPARVLAQIINDYAYYDSQKTLTADGFYYCTVKTLEERTTFKLNKQLECLNKLEQLGLIKVEYREQRKRYIKPFPENILYMVRKD